MMEICFVKVSLYDFFLVQKNSANELWSVEDPKGADAETKVRF